MLVSNTTVIKTGSHAVMKIIYMADHLQTESLFTQATK